MPRLVHITDIHFGSSHIKGVDAKADSNSYEKHFRQSPADYLPDGLRRLNPKPDLILFGGDYVTGRDAGAGSGKDFTPSLHLIQRIVTHPKEYLSKLSQVDAGDRVLLVPGNHDVERGKEDGCEAFKRAFTDYLTPFTAPRANPKVAKYAPLFLFKQLRLAIYCLSTVDISGQPNEKILRIIDSLRKEDAKKHEEHIKALNDFLYPDPASVTREQLDRFSRQNEAFQKGEKDHGKYTKIVLCHHPFMPTSSVELKAYSGILAGGKFLENARGMGYQLLIHGHTHREMFSIQEHVGERSGLIHVGSPSFGSDDSSSGITIIDLGPDTSTLQLTRRYFSEVSREFEQKETLSVRLSADLSARPDGAAARVLLDQDLRALITDKKVIQNGDIDRIEAASYDCRLGYRYSKSGEVFDLSPNDKGKPGEIELSPGDSVLIRTAEEFDVPKDMFFFATVLSKHMRDGLVAGISHFVDPGFQGAFYFPLVNISGERRTIRADEPILSIKVMQLDRSVDKGWIERHGTRRMGF